MTRHSIVLQHNIISKIMDLWTSQQVHNLSYALSAAVRFR